MEQKAQFRVQTVPKIKKVSVPLAKHSPRLGQRASWQTEFGTVWASFSDSCRVAFTLLRLCRNQSGNRCVVCFDIAPYFTREAIKWASRFFRGDDAGLGDIASEAVSQSPFCLYLRSPFLIKCIVLSLPQAAHDCLYSKRLVRFLICYAQTPGAHVGLCLAKCKKPLL